MATYLGRFQNLARLSSEWAADDPVLLLGEFGIADAGASLPVLKVGDGVRPFSALPALGGAGGAANDYVAGPTATLPPGSQATVTIDNTVDPPTISFGIPSGDTGPPNVLSIGTVTTGPAGGAADATITGSSPAQVLNLTIPAGVPGPANSLTVGDVDTLAPGAPATVTIEGIPPDQTINFGIPVGASNVLTVGTVEGSPPGSEPEVTITGVSPAQTINFVLPTGETGPANELGIGTVETGEPGTDVIATITGDYPDQVLNLTIPRGDPGIGAPADPAALVGLVPKPGVLETYLRSDGAPALDQGIVPHWTGQHDYALVPTVAGVKVVLESRALVAGAGIAALGNLSADRTIALDPNYGDWGGRYPHATYTEFDAGAAYTMPLGAAYVQGLGNGPGLPGATQYFKMRLGIGSEYVGQYALDIAIGGHNMTGTDYIAIRRRTAGAWGAWGKIAAGYADSANTANSASTAGSASAATRARGYAHSHPDSYWTGGDWDGTSMWALNTYTISTDTLHGPCRVNYAEAANNSNLLAGYGPSTNADPNTVLIRTPNAYVYGYYFNSSAPNDENAPVSQIWTSNGSDTFLRKASLQHLRNSLGATQYQTAASFTTPGYMVFTNGFKVQWGGVTCTGNNANTIYYPYAFAAIASAVITGGATSASAQDNNPIITNTTLSYFGTWNAVDNAVACLWIATGY